MAPTERRQRGPPQAPGRRPRPVQPVAFRRPSDACWRGGPAQAPGRRPRLVQQRSFRRPSDSHCRTQIVADGPTSVRRRRPIAGFDRCSVDVRRPTRRPRTTADLGQRPTSTTTGPTSPVGLRTQLPTVDVDVRRNRCTRRGRAAAALALGRRGKSSASGGPRWRRLQVGAPFLRLTGGWAAARRLEAWSGGLPDAGGWRLRGRCRLRVTVRRSRSPTLAMLFSASPGVPV